MNKQQEAANRIDTYIFPTHNQPFGSIEDLLVDIMHHCTVNGENFSNLLHDAKLYYLDDCMMAGE
jgi:hypothetical protein